MKRFTKYPKSFKVDGVEMVGEWDYSIRETYYNEDGEITMHSNDARPAFGDSLEGIKETLTLMLRACEKEVVDLETLEYAKNDFEDDLLEDNIDLDYEKEDDKDLYD